MELVHTQANWQCWQRHGSKRKRRLNGQPLLVITQFNPDGYTMSAGIKWAKSFLASFKSTELQIYGHFWLQVTVYCNSLFKQTCLTRHILDKFLLNTNNS